MDLERPRILLVEDDEVDRMAARRALEGEGFPCELTFAGTVGDAAARLREGDFALLLVDYGLPDGSGLEVQARAGKTPCIFITGVEDLEVAVTAMKAGASDFLVKDAKRHYLQLLPLAIRATLERRRNEEARERAEEALKRAHHELEVRVAERTSELAQAVDELKKEVFERERAQESLKASEKRYQDLYDDAPDMFLLVDTETGAILRGNQTLATALGYTQEELVGRFVLDLYTPDSAAATKRYYLSSPGPPRGLRNVERRLQKKDGSALDASFTASMVREAPGEPLLSQLIFRDITERKKLEAQLHQAEHMEAIGQLAGGVAHDFNNILQVISSAAEFASQGLPPETPRSKHIAQIEKAVERASRLIRQLLAFSRSQVLQAADVDFESILDEMVEMLQRLIGENIRLEHVSEHPLDPVRIDLAQMEQVLINLCVNARDAMPGGGTLTIEAKNAVLDAGHFRAHPGARPGHYVLIRVSDTGCGMDDETLRRAFDPFFTTKEGERGTGLGLASVHGIVEQHEGLIHVDSAVGEGSTFEIYLPVGERAQPTSKKERQEGTGFGKETILLVEDDEDIRHLTKRVLEEAGYTVLAAADGLEAIEVFDAHADEIALAVIDMVLPGASGREVWERIRATRPEVAVLFSSGYSRDLVSAELLPDEGAELIQKPYRREGLLQKVRTMLDAQQATYSV